MRTTFYLTVLLSLFSVLNAQAQNNATITGQIKDGKGNAVNAATVMLLSSPGDKLVKTAVADAEGKYEIGQVKAGSYYISVNSAGHAKTSSEVFLVKDDEANKAVPVIALKPADKTLQGVTVTGSYKKPMIEVTADKTVFNVESSINATGSNAFELLQKSPGVITDKDDNIIMKGKTGVRIYIDGRPTQMDAADLPAYLKSINSADIESIEIISNPSAKYDASGNAGIINFKLKKNKKVGFNGSVTAGIAMAKNPKTNTALSLNFRNKKVNLFSNYSNNWGINQSTINIYREQDSSIYDQVSKQVNTGWSHNIKAGMDIFATKESTIGFIVTANLNDNTGETNSRTPISNLYTHKKDSILYAMNSVPGNTSNVDLNFNYRYADSVGHEFSIDADYTKYKSRKKSYQPNAYYAPYPELLLSEDIYRNETPNNINIYTAKIDYEAPLKKGKISFGVKLSDVKADNMFNYYNVIDGVDHLDPNVSNSFSYKENINAGYINYFRPLGKKWNVQAGLRIENTVSKGSLTRADNIMQANSNVTRNYTDPFPSAAITYNASMNHSFNLNYSRRIDRPNYPDLNPFENRLDKLTYQKGNPFLKPQYTDNIQLTHTFKYRYVTSLGYSHIKDFIAWVIDTSSGGSGFISKKNLKQDIVNLNFALPIQINKWWSIYTNINVYHSKYQGYVNPKTYFVVNVTSGSFYAQNSFMLGNGYTGEVSGFYNAPAVWAGTFKSRDMGGMDIGMQKQLFNGQGNVKISFTDLLHTMKWKGSSTYSGANSTASGTWESQQLRFNFTYRFGNKQVKQARQHQTSSEEEKKRTESDGGFGGN